MKYYFSFFLDKKRNKKVKGCDQILRFCLKRQLQGATGIHQTRSFVAQTVVASDPPRFKAPFRKIGICSRPVWTPDRIPTKA
jgi:hypothetical protein